MSTLNNIPSNFIWNSSTIKSLRVYADMSQTDLAQRVGVRQQTISEWETDTYRPRGASIKMLNMISIEFGYDFRSISKNHHTSSNVFTKGNQNNNENSEKLKSFKNNDNLWWKTIKQPSRQRSVTFKEFPM